MGAEGSKNPDGSPTQPRKVATPASKSPKAAGTPGDSPSPNAMTPGMFITQQAGVFSDRYQGLKVLGKGSFGEVIQCKDKVTSNECAVKVISKKTLKKNSSSTALLREVQLLKELDHPNIMKLYEFFEDSGYFYLVGELYSGGELFDEIINRKRFNEADAARIVRQVLSGITYMHNNKIVHRDLKPENLLLESKDPDALIKIIDFGLSTHFEGAKKMKDKIGTAYYIAPEVLHSTYDEKCDVWSIGVILYILLSGCPPFYGSSEYEILKRVETGKYSFNLPQWRKVSESAKDLIRRMLTYVPSMRISTREAIEHEWLKSMTEKNDVTDVADLESTMWNIRQFQTSQKLAQAALLYMGSKLTTAEETKELTAIFSKLDANGDGQLDRDELCHGYIELMKLKGVDCSKLDEQAVQNEVDQVLESIDFDKNGYLEYSEFVTVAMDRRRLLSRNRLKRAFDMFDTDQSGQISSQELATMLGLSEDTSTDWAAMIKDIDSDGDGQIDFNEFVAMLSKLCK